jgi:hypothetical protein
VSANREDLVELYEAAKERLDAIRGEWFAQGQPLLGKGSTGQLVEHALHRLLRDQEMAVARLADMAKIKNAGPDRVGVIRQQYGPKAAPSARLRRIQTARSKREPKKAG